MNGIELAKRVADMCAMAGCIADPGGAERLGMLRVQRGYDPREEVAGFHFFVSEDGGVVHTSVIYARHGLAYIEPGASAPLAKLVLQCVAQIKGES